jgi:hypothetical protein
MFEDFMRKQFAQFQYRQFDVIAVSWQTARAEFH